jgi:hypothetical protein
MANKKTPASDPDPAKPTADAQPTNETAPASSESTGTRDPASAPTADPATPAQPDASAPSTDTTSSAAEADEVEFPLARTYDLKAPDGTCSIGVEGVTVRVPANGIVKGVPHEIATELIGKHGFTVAQD